MLPLVLVADTKTGMKVEKQKRRDARMNNVASHGYLSIPLQTSSTRTISWPCVGLSQEQKTSPPLPLSNANTKKEHAWLLSAKRYALSPDMVPNRSMVAQ